jgi:predicted transposase YdaD
MPKPFDATLNALIDRHLDDWVAFLTTYTNLPIGPATLLDTDLSTTLQADRLFRIETDPPYLIHLELEASGALKLPERLLHYNVNARLSQNLEVWSVVVLLRPTANPSDVTDVLEAQVKGEECITFCYTTIRLWKLPFDTLLNAGPGLLPLAMLTNEASQDLERSMLRVDEQLRAESSSSKIRDDDISAIYFLLGLRYQQEQIQKIIQGVIMFLEESTTYQYVMQKGQARGEALGQARGEALGQARGEALGQARGRELGQIEAARASVVRVGAKRLGPASSDVLSKIDGITELAILETLLDRVIEAKTWDEIFEEI